METVHTKMVKFSYALKMNVVVFFAVCHGHRPTSRR